MSKHIREIIALKTEHLQREMELRGRLSDVAIIKSETAILERMESSNNKFALLKEQAGQFATKSDLCAQDDKIQVLQKFMWAGLGVLSALQILLMIYLKN